MIKNIGRPQLYLLFKFSIYLLVTINAIEFINSDIKAAAATLGDEFSWKELHSVFSASIDSIAWLVLLVVYELETSVVEDDVLNRGYKWLFYAISLLCYVAITTALLGYWGKLQLLLNYSPANIVDLCTYSSKLNLMTQLDEYTPISASNCAGINTHDLQKLKDLPVVFSASLYTGFRSITTIAWIDVINASTWLLIVFLIRLDIVLELRGGMSSVMARLNKLVKLVSYLVLFAMALYWAIFSQFIDGWDAFLWLVCFFFIELNLVNWQNENESKESKQV